MIHVYHVFICLFLVIFQTTVLVGVPLHLYDLLGPFMVYLGAFQRPREAIVLVLFSGLAMDGITGGVFGVHLTAYLWIYAGVRWAIQFLHVGNAILMPLLVGAGVVFESLVAAFAAVVLASPSWPMHFVFSVVSAQAMLGIITGPFLMLLLIRGRELVHWIGKNIVGEKDSLRTP